VAMAMGLKVVRVLINWVGKRGTVAAPSPFYSRQAGFVADERGVML